MGSISSVLGVTVPVTIPFMNKVKYYSAGYMAGAIKNDSTGWAWGNPISGDPIEVIEDVKFLDAGSISVSFVKYDGTVWSIGSNSQGNFGDGTTLYSPTIPIQMLGITNAVRVFIIIPFLIRLMIHQ